MCPAGVIGRNGAATAGEASRLPRHGAAPGFHQDNTRGLVRGVTSGEIVRNGTGWVWVVRGRGKKRPSDHRNFRWQLSIAA